MKILLLNDYGRAVGGAEVIILGLRDALRRRGHDARLFGSNAPTSAQPSQADFSCCGSAGPLRTVLQCANFFAAASLRQTLRDFRPDVVHVNLYLTQLSPLILPLLRAVPSVYYAQWYRAVCPLGTKRLPSGAACELPAGRACLRGGCVPLRDWLPLQGQRALDRRWRGSFRRVAAISQAVADKLVRFGPWSPEEVEVIPAGTPWVAPRQEMAPEPLIVFTGRLVAEKGVGVLLQAMARMRAAFPRACLRVVGAGPERGRLEQEAVDLGLAAHVVFTGALSHGETIREMRSAWAVCVPSLWEEPFGMVAIEAQMNGVAVIASDGGGLRELIGRGETGWLVPTGEVEALAQALRQVGASPEGAFQMGQAGHQRASAHFSLATFARRWESVYGALRDTLRP